MAHDNPNFNASGYRDPVASHVIKQVTKEENARDQRAFELINVLKFLIQGTGYELIHRIAIKDKLSGKEYR